MGIQEFGEITTPPPGTIALWNEPLTEIPTGWAICDGNNGTPNLLDKFVRSVGVTDETGTTGGQHSFSLTESQLPPHSHTGTTDSGGNHSHSYWTYSDDGDDGHQGAYDEYIAPKHNSSGYDADTTTKRNHTHSASLNNTGSGSSIDNRPEFHEVAFIMKT